MIYALYFLSGIALGAFLAHLKAARRAQAPCPVNYEGSNVSGLGGRLNEPRKVVMCGAEWTVYGGRQ